MRRIERKVIAGYGWRWAVVKDGVVVAHSDYHYVVQTILDGLDREEVESRPLSQSDLDSRPEGFIPQGTMRRFVWNAVHTSA